MWHPSCLVAPHRPANAICGGILDNRPAPQHDRELAGGQTVQQAQGVWLDPRSCFGL
jgi:hypothetical protein